MRSALGRRAPCSLRSKSQIVLFTGPTHRPSPQGAWKRSLALQEAIISPLSAWWKPGTVDHGCRTGILGSEITGLTGGPVRRHRSRAYIRHRASSDPRCPAPIGVQRSTPRRWRGTRTPVVSGPKGNSAWPHTRNDAVSLCCVVNARDVGQRSPNRRRVLKGCHIARFTRHKWRLALRVVAFHC